MQQYESFDVFWAHHQAESHNQYGFFDWQTVMVKHVSDQDYTTNRLLARDTLGFQPMVLLQANPFTREHRSCMIKHVTDDLFHRYLHYVRHRYTDSLTQRFGSFHPDATTAYTEYPDWVSFSSAWLDRPGRPVYGENVLLLIDHTPAVEYWTRKQMGEPTLPYQRLLVTTFHAPTKKFYDFFVRDIDDDSADRVKTLIQSRVYLHNETLFHQKA